MTTGAPAAWLARLESRYREAQEEEEAELEGQEGTGEGREGRRGLCAAGS